MIAGPIAQMWSTFRALRTSRKGFGHHTLVPKTSVVRGDVEFMTNFFHPVQPEKEVLGSGADDPDHGVTRFF
jgi:hypothetical protein